MINDLSGQEAPKRIHPLQMKPEDVMMMVRRDPTLASSLSTPRIKAAIVDCSKNPFNIRKYQNDSEIMDVFDRVQKLFHIEPHSTNR